MCNPLTLGVHAGTVLDVVDLAFSPAPNLLGARPHARD